MIADVAVGLAVAAAVLCPALGRGRRARVVAREPGPGIAPWRRSAAQGRWSPPWRRTTKEADLVLLLVAQVAALLKSGASPRQAWRRAAGVATDDEGVPEAAALARQVGGPGPAGALVAACRLAADVGAPLVGVLDEVAASISSEARADAEREAAFAGPRTTTRVLAWLPLVGILLGVVLGADPVGTALDGGAGSVAAVLGILFLLVGRHWSKRLVSQARRSGDGP